MNYTIANSILSNKTSYALLFICITHLGCSSIYNKMDQSDELSTSSTSSHESQQSRADNKEKSELEEKLENFKKNTCCLVEKSTVDKEKNDTFREFIQKYKDKSKVYEIFLKNYEYICNPDPDFCIYGICSNSLKFNEAKDVLSNQKGFYDRCKIHNICDKKSLCWLIAQGEDNYYYFDFSDEKKGYIYYMNIYGQSNFFAKDFLDFLDRFFISYENKIEEKCTQSSKKSEDLHSIVKKFLSLKEKKCCTGSPLYNIYIKEVLENMSKKVKHFDSDKLKEYKKFLNQYGSICGEGFEIYGRTKNQNTKKDSIKYIQDIQNEFEKHCKKSRHCREEQEKSRWLIAKDKTYQYYICLEEDPLCEGVIYRIDGHANPIKFAENFLDFLDKFIKVCT